MCMHFTFLLLNSSRFQSKKARGVNCENSERRIVYRNVPLILRRVTLLERFYNGFIFYGSVYNKHICIENIEISRFSTSQSFSPYCSDNLEAHSLQLMLSTVSTMFKYSTWLLECASCWIVLNIGRPLTGWHNHRQYVQGTLTFVTYIICRRI